MLVEGGGMKHIFELLFIDTLDILFEWKKLYPDAIDYIYQELLVLDSYTHIIPFRTLNPELYEAYLTLFIPEILDNNGRINLTELRKLIENGENEYVYIVIPYTLLRDILLKGEKPEGYISIKDFLALYMEPEIVWLKDRAGLYLHHRGKIVHGKRYMEKEAQVKLFEETLRKQI